MVKLKMKLFLAVDLNFIYCYRIVQLNLIDFWWISLLFKYAKTMESLQWHSKVVMLFEDICAYVCLRPAQRHSIKLSILDIVSGYRHNKKLCWYLKTFSVGYTIYLVPYNKKWYLFSSGKKYLNLCGQII